MALFNRIPGVDDTNNFNASVRKAIANSVASEVSTAGTNMRTEVDKRVAASTNFLTTVDAENQYYDRDSVDDLVKDLIDRIKELEDRPTSELVEHTLTGNKTIPVKDNGTYVLQMTSTHTVTLSGGSSGGSIAILSDFPFRIAGTTYTAGLHTGLKLATFWKIVTVESSVPNPVVILTGTTQTSASVTWAVVPGATSYLSRINGVGSGVNIGNVTSWVAEGLPHSQPGTLSIRAVGPDGMSEWVSVSFSTSAPPLTAIRLIPEDPNIVESGNASVGWTYTFNKSVYGGWLRSGSLKIPANQNGFIQFSVPSMSKTLTVDLNGNSEPSLIGVGIPPLGGGNKYTANVRPYQPESTFEALAGDVIRIGRTGNVVWLRVSRDNAATFSEIFSKIATSEGAAIAPSLYFQAMGNEATGVIANIRGTGWTTS